MTDLRLQLRDTSIDKQYSTSRHLIRFDVNKSISSMRLIRKQNPTELILQTRHHQARHHVMRLQIQTNITGLQAGKYSHTCL